MTPHKSLRLGIFLGFTLMVVLMAALTTVGSLYMAKINRHVEQIVTQNNAKTELTHAMKDAYRERTVILNQLSLLKDPFEQNDVYISFGEYAVDFMIARNTLEKMPLSKEEKAINTRLRALTTKATPFVARAVELAMDGKDVEARKLIQDEIIDTQKLISLEFEKFLELQKQATDSAVASAHAAYKNARLIMWLLGGWIIAVSIAIGFFVIRNANTQADTLEHQAMFDNLTNLPNRVLFADRLQQAALIARREKRPFSLFALDLNRFKEINDTLGHHVGDHVLQQVGTRMRACLRDSDTVARMGGDEFTVLLSTVSDTEGAVLVAKKLLQAISTPIIFAGQSLEIGASLGIAMFPNNSDDVEMLIRQADAAMYLAKQTQSGYRVYNHDMDNGAENRTALQNELRQAIVSDQLVLHYQPKIDFHANRVTGVEALVRWQHPQYGLMSPDKFIPLAEQTGLIKPLTKWVMRTALHQAQEWRREGMVLTMAINVSAVSIQDPEFPEQVAQMLDDFTVPSSQIELEITETAIMAEPVRAVACLKKLNALGLHIAIDDFGTGYSSMAYLKDLLVAKIKIDKSFVTDMGTKHNDAVIVRSTIELGHNLGLKVVAEGVEDELVWDRLKGLGCDSAQGYYMSRPLPAEQLRDWLRKSEWGASDKRDDA